MSEKIESIRDINGRFIKENDVLRNVDNGEIRLVVIGQNSVHGTTGLCAVNSVIGAKDWLSVFPDGLFEVIGNAGIDGDKA